MFEERDATIINVQSIKCKRRQIYGTQILLSEDPLVFSPNVLACLFLGL